MAAGTTKGAASDFPWILLVVGALLGSGCASSSPPPPEPLSGLIVEQVKPDGLAAKAGAQPGDRLLRWRRGEAGGELVSPFDLDRLALEEAPRGAVSIAGRRGGEALSFSLGDGAWAINVRPDMTEQAVGELADARRVGGVEGAERLGALARDEGRSAVRTWLLVLAAETGALEGSPELWAEAAAAASQDLATLGCARERQGRALQSASRLDEAAAAYAQALASRPEGSLVAAASLNDLGSLALYRGDLEAADGYLHRALEIRERLAPESLGVAMSLNNLGLLAWYKGDLEAAEGAFRRAHEVYDDRAARCLPAAMNLNNLGVLAARRGDLESAQAFYGRALEIREELAPTSLDMAMSLTNLGILAWNRGDFEGSEAYHRRALDIQEHLAPGSLTVAGSLANLGILASDRGELEAAEGYYRRALEIEERLAPDSLALAADLGNLGVVAEKRGDLAEAEAYQRRALEIQERLAPDSLDVGFSLVNLGILASDRGELEAAEGYYRRALEIEERLAPDSLAVAASFANLGNVALKRGDLETAEAQQRRAEQLYERSAPGSAELATCLHDLAQVFRAQGRTSEALEALQRAVRALEAQQRRLGGTPEHLGDFRAQYLEIYRDLVDVLLEEGRREEAFGVVESAHARALLAMLAERDLVAHDVPSELERERHLTNAAHDQTMAALGELAAEDEDARTGLLAELAAIEQHQDEIRARVRAASPRLAELRYPEPVDLAGAKQALEPGGLLLAYFLGQGKTYLFALGPEPERFMVYTLAVGEQSLREEVKRLRRLIQWGGIGATSSGEDPGEEALAQASRALSTALLAPAADAIAACSRVIVVPDGPLHVLPFAALLDPGTGRYLVEEKPLSVVASATVMAQLKQQRRLVEETRLVAFGDPLYPQAAAVEEPLVLEHARRSGLSLKPLPATRLEVEGLGRLLGDQAILWLGDDATEERAKAVGEGVTALHFATHGFVDERRPLSSGLALTIPEQPAEGQDNGLLQAWEVFEQVRLDADLVTLSACETALGKEVAGEGILGLTRAFQYAGARTVLASLWAVADESTAELMGRFYANLQSGLPKDEALRRAQVELIRGPVEVPAADGATRRLDASHPFHWAAFELVGDWQ